MKNQDYKLKYQDLKLKFMDAVDVSFRLGFEQGAQSAQMQQAQAATQQAQMGQQQMGQEGSSPHEIGQEEHSDGSELDQHIGTLEGLLASSKPGSSEQTAIQKSLKEIKAFQSNLKQKYDFKKAEQAIKEIGKALKSPFTLSKGATKNLNENGKKALNMQEQIVEDLMKSFQDEEKKAAEAITKTLNFEQLIKE